MEDDEVERQIELPSPIAYAFEPIRRRVAQEVRRAEKVEPVLVWGAERVGNTTWCRCGCCSAMPTTIESICCQEADLVHVMRGESCITAVRTFGLLCREVEVLEVAMLSLKDVRAETLERPVNSSLFRLTAYRQFTLWARGHLGRKNRIPIPACVVHSIRAVFPSPEYHGFEYVYDDL